jgi:Na+/proline symporter
MILFSSWTGGAAVLTTLVPGVGISEATLLIVTVIGTYSAIGGLGATFYVGYVTTAGIFIIMLTFAFKIFHDDSDPNAPLGEKLVVNIFETFF